ncbi:MAG: hypothetical protein ABIP42_09480 [Planctomycetota bacterium]
MDDGVRQFGAVYAELQAELDWELLGSTYCEGEGRDFFDAALRERMLDCGLRLADDLASRLERGPLRRSVYLGAALAELAPILVEHLVLQREVIWLNLESAETRELRRALELVAARQGCALPEPSGNALESLARASCDHLWMVSVLTDPDHFPALHDELYARAGDPLATGRGWLEEERARASALCRALLETAAARSTLTSSDEELQFLQPIATALGWRLEIPAKSKLSAVVGDRVRICALTK